MPTSYPVSTISKLFGLSERRVQQLARDGVIPKPKKNQYELVGCVRAYINYLQQRAFGQGVTPQDTHLERARLLKAQADKTELEVASLQGRLISVEQTAEDWRSIVMACRSKLLALPSKSALQLASLGSDPNKIEHFLKRLIYEALTELAEPDSYENISKLSEHQHKDYQSLDATAGIDGEPVGGSVPEAKSGRKRRTRKMEN